MKILLDTQAFIWFVSGDKRLGKKTIKNVLDKTNEVYVSFISFFEITIKSSIGKLSFNPSIIDDLERIDVNLLQGDKKSLLYYRIFNNENKDPFDNFLIATAQTHRLVLVTSDHKILTTDAPGVTTHDATK